MLWKCNANVVLFTQWGRDAYNWLGLFLAAATGDECKQSNWKVLLTGRGMEFGNCCASVCVHKSFACFFHSTERLESSLTFFVLHIHSSGLKVLHLLRLRYVCTYIEEARVPFVMWNLIVLWNKWNEFEMSQKLPNKIKPQTAFIYTYNKDCHLLF